MKKGNIAQGLIIELGHRFEDRISGLQGIAFSLNFHMNGSVQMALQAKSKDGTYLPDAYSFDIQNLKYVDKGVNQTTILSKNYDYPLGSKVKDKLSDLVGIATKKVIFCNGCIHYEIVTKNKDGMPDTAFLSADRFELIEYGSIITDDIRRENEKKSKEKNRKPVASFVGGPCTKAHRM